MYQMFKVASSYVHGLYNRAKTIRPRKIKEFMNFPTKPKSRRFLLLSLIAQNSMATSIKLIAIMGEDKARGPIIYFFCRRSPLGQKLRFCICLVP